MIYTTETADEAIRLFMVDAFGGGSWVWLNQTRGEFMRVGGAVKYRVQFTKKGWEIS